MSSRLWVKLALAFVFVALVGVVLVAVLANRAASLGFQRYLAAGELSQLADLQNDLSAYYLQQGDWSGVSTVLRRSGIGPETTGGGYFLRVLDSSGQVVGTRGGQNRSLEEYDIQLPILVKSEQVGTLLAVAASRGGHAAQQYLDSLNQALILAGSAAILIALFLGILLAHRLTTPLRRLMVAARAVAGGDFTQQVSVGSKDEIGELADDFNQMANALERAEEQRQQLLADTAHDLRTPISIMRSHLEAMLDGVFEPSPENLAVVHEETLHLSRLIDDVRTLSLAESGHLPLNLALVDMNDLVQQAVAAFLPLAEADGVHLQASLDGRAPIAADSARLHQVLANLIANALRYAPQGASDAPSVSVTVGSEDKEVSVRVADNGPGLTSEQQEHIFDRFWRSDAARTRDQGGSGLGLAIAQGIVEAHGGSLIAASQPGEGTEMIVRLPRAITE